MRVVFRQVPKARITVECKYVKLLILPTEHLGNLNKYVYNEIE